MTTDSSSRSNRWSVPSNGRQCAFCEITQGPCRESIYLGFGSTSWDLARNPPPIEPEHLIALVKTSVQVPCSHGRCEASALRAITGG